MLSTGGRTFGCAEMGTLSALHGFTWGTLLLQSLPKDKEQLKFCIPVVEEARFSSVPGPVECRQLRAALEPAELLHE